jgi:hypothetical protein
MSILHAIDQVFPAALGLSAAGGIAYLYIQAKRGYKEVQRIQAEAIAKNDLPDPNPYVFSAPVPEHEKLGMSEEEYNKLKELYFIFQAIDEETAREVAEAEKARIVPHSVGLDDLGFIYHLYMDNELVYIGLTIDLRRRLKQHSESRKFGQYNRCASKAVPFKHMPAIEGALIRKHKPPLNRSSGGYRQHDAEYLAAFESGDYTEVDAIAAYQKQKKENDLMYALDEWEA